MEQELVRPLAQVSSRWFTLQVYTFGVGLLTYPGHASTGRDEAHIHSPNSCAHRIADLPIPARGGEEMAPGHCACGSAELPPGEVLQWI
jgi:hypothetical protein